MNTDEQLKELEASRLAFEDWTGHSKPPERIDDDTYLSKPLQSDWRLWKGAVEYANERNEATNRQLLDLYNAEVLSLRELLRKTEQELLDVSSSLKGQRELAATHRCKVCGALWICFRDSWSLASQQCGPCCDNQPMDAQIEAIGIYGDQDARWSKLVESANKKNDSLRTELAAAKEREQGLRDALDNLTGTLRSHDAISYDCDRSGEKYCDCLDKALKKAEQTTQPPQSPWRPIAAAPKDGTEIILGSLVPGRVTAGSWIEVTDKDDEEKDFNGWGSWDGGFTNEHPPTHWMPLPQPPTKGEEV